MMNTTPSDAVILKTDALGRVRTPAARRERLLDEGQILESAAAEAGGRAGLDPKKLAGIVVDDADATLAGQWSESKSLGPWVGASYRHDGNKTNVQSTARFETRLPRTGRYEVRLAYSPKANRATRVPATVHFSAGERTVFVNEKLKPPINDLFVSLGVFEFSAETPAAVVVSNQGADGYVVIDAVQWLPKE